MVRIKVHTVEALSAYTQFRHEDLYVEIEKMVIRSDELISQRDVNIEFHDITVVLCTVSMLSNPTLDSCGLFRVVPVKSLVIDEASQIDIFEFMVIPILTYMGD